METGICKSFVNLLSERKKMANPRRLQTPE
jgi:hypothetical protein